MEVIEQFKLTVYRNDNGDVRFRLSESGDRATIMHTNEGGWSVWYKGSTCYERGLSLYDAARADQLVPVIGDTLLRAASAGDATR